MMLTIVYAFNIIDRFLLGLLLPMIRADLALTDTVVGMLTGPAFAVLYAVSGLPVAWLADRRSRPAIIATGFAFWSMMTIAAGWVRNGTDLAVVRFLLGAGEASCVPPSNSMIADLFSPAGRPLALACFSAAGSLGILVGFPVIGSIAQRHGWRAAFMIIGLAGIVVALTAVLTMRDPGRGGRAPASAPEGVPLAITLGALLRNRGFIFATCAAIFITANIAISAAWLPTFLTRVHGLDTAHAGLVLGVFRGSFGIMGALGGGWLASLLGRRHGHWRAWVPALAMLFMVPAEFMLLFGGDASIWKAGLAFEAFFAMAQVGPLYALAMEDIPSGSRAVAVSILLIASQLLGQSVGPLATGALSDAVTFVSAAHSLRSGLLIAPACALVGAIFCFATESGRRCMTNL